jgi:hypothetical protein
LGLNVPCLGKNVPCLGLNVPCLRGDHARVGGA